MITALVATAFLVWIAHKVRPYRGPGDPRHTFADDVIYFFEWVVFGFVFLFLICRIWV